MSNKIEDEFNDEFYDDGDGSEAVEDDQDTDFDNDDDGFVDTQSPKPLWQKPIFIVGGVLALAAIGVPLKAMLSGGSSTPAPAELTQQSPPPPAEVMQQTTLRNPKQSNEAMDSLYSGDKTVVVNESIEDSFTVSPSQQATTPPVVSEKEIQPPHEPESEITPAQQPMVDMSAFVTRDELKSIIKSDDKSKAKLARLQKVIISKEKKHAVKLKQLNVKVSALEIEVKNLKSQIKRTVRKHTAEKASTGFTPFQAQSEPEYWLQAIVPGQAWVVESKTGRILTMSENDKLPNNVTVTAIDAANNTVTTSNGNITFKKTVN